jgi:4-hydroxy-3-polyprenylbenzoate decarboxylase
MHLVVAITGASGVEYGNTLLKYLYKLPDTTVDIVVSEEGKALIAHECSISYEELMEGAENVYDNTDLASPIASGSKKFDGMVIVPCSMSTLSKIAVGISDNLITRTASVAIKENRKLILVPRETPLSPIHLKNMSKLAKYGVCMLPAMPAFYPKPDNIKDLLNFIAGKILDQLGIDNDLYKRWRD